MKRKQRNADSSKGSGRGGYRENQERGQDFWNKERNESELGQQGRGQYEQGQQGGVGQQHQQDGAEPDKKDSAPQKKNKK